MCTQAPAQKAAVADAFTTAVTKGIADGNAAEVAAVAMQTQAANIFKGTSMLAAAPAPEAMPAAPATQPGAVPGGELGATMPGFSGP